jgi:glycosyltransferase involved in cell wall biosynthesis
MNSKLTVLMAVHNGAPYLRTAIDSILQQTYPDFCFLIVDDASTDGTREIVRSYEDQRIQLVCLNRNAGQAAALNIGLRRATTPWIARMDADDYSAPTRLEEQMQVLDADHSLSCVGTHAWTFRDDPRVIEGVITTPLHHADIECALLRRTPIIHGSIVVSRAALLDVGAYNERYRIAADLEIYDRLVPRYITANIPKQLLGVRRHKDQDSRSKRAFDESIEICSRRLLTNNYSRQDAAIVRATLSRSYLHRARFSGGEHKYLELWKDILRAIRVAPNTFFWHCFLVFVVRLISERNRAKLRRVLTRSAPGLSERL